MGLFDRLTKALRGGGGTAATAAAGNAPAPPLPPPLPPLYGGSPPTAAAAASPIRLSPTPREAPSRPPPAPAAAAAYEEVMMSSELLQKMQELGPLEKRTYTGQPTSPLSLSEKRLLSAIEVRHGSTVTAGEAEVERERPRARRAVRGGEQEEDWRRETAEEGSGLLSEVQAVDLLARRRDKGEGLSAAELARAFSLDPAEVELVLASVAAPHYSFDKKEGLERGTWTPREDFALGSGGARKARRGGAGGAGKPRLTTTIPSSSATKSRKDRQQAAASGVRPGGSPINR